MRNFYELRGHKIRERQIFLRTYTLVRERQTAKYFIKDGRAYYLNDDGGACLCNFGADFLNRSPTIMIEPLDEFYGGKFAAPEGGADDA
jgi:hypothetical protein